LTNIIWSGLTQGNNPNAGKKKNSSRYIFGFRSGLISVGIIEDAGALGGVCAILRISVDVESTQARPGMNFLYLLLFM